MYNSIVKAVRKTISAEKNRFENENYDLDLTYITERVIAMSFPADGVESAYRNSIYDVSQMLKEHHDNHFKIFNLSERKYDYNLFNGNVYDWCGFPDHHAPPLALLFKIVITIYNYLQEDPSNVAIVHCMAGKGRTGTVISCLLLYAGLFDNAQDAMRYFAVKRSSNTYGITGPSQIRYIKYFSSIYLGNQVPAQNALFLKTITMHTIPKFFLGPLKQGVCPVLNIYSATQKGLRIFSSAPIEGDTKETRTYLAGTATLQFEVRKIVRGDILVVFSHITPFYRVEQIARFNFHTGMFQNNRLVLHKSECDGSDGDRRFANDFHFTLDFDDPIAPPSNNQITMFQKEIKKELKWISHESKKNSKNGSVVFFPKNASEKIKTAKDIASKQGGASVHSGYLMKKGHNFKNWRRRWFVLKDNVLSYYKSPKDTAPAGQIPLSEIVDVMLIDEREGYTHCFQLVTIKALVYEIAADNERDLDDWVETIKNAKKTIHEAGRLFVEILDVKYSFNGFDDSSTVPISERNDVDLITYLTLSMGKKRDNTPPQFVKFNPNFQYAGEVVVYDQPADLTIGLWFRSSALQIKDTLVAELQFSYANLLATQNFKTEYRPFTNVYTDFITDLSIRIGMSYKATEDLNLYEKVSGTWQPSPTENLPTRKFSDQPIGRSRRSPSNELDYQTYNHTTTDDNNNNYSSNIRYCQSSPPNSDNKYLIHENRNLFDSGENNKNFDTKVLLSPNISDTVFLEALHQQLDEDCDLNDTNDIMNEFERNLMVTNDNFEN